MLFFLGGGGGGSKQIIVKNNMKYINIYKNGKIISYPKNSHNQSE